MGAPSDADRDSVSSEGDLSQISQSVDPLTSTAPVGGSFDIARTLDHGDAEPSAPAFSAKLRSRYQPLWLLGQGGMGKVFLAHDLRLERKVAIKFVRGEAPALAHRVVVEARAQARVSHDRVCKVYEVGESDGQVYIVMQYIDGQSLGAMAPELRVEQKVLVVRDAALGVHEAHRVGIIHRDIKPANILVERSDDGSLKVYVTDFGLARSSDDETTETGTVLGTPAFMSPEQARGEVGRLDRRADVYSLGASLYQLLTGSPPIPGDNGLEILNNVGEMDPVPPRAANRDLAPDLEAIVLKCLEKERSARYDSALSLAEDLDRFLRGEPVRARSTRLGYRLRKRIAKHKAVAGAAVAVLIAASGAVGWGIAAESRASQREQFARRFTEMVERVEAMARYSALSPAHDVRADQTAMRARMGELEAEVRRAGSIALGPGDYALGRGYLALGDDAKAKDLLEQAWGHGFREPRAAYALALVMGHIYQEQLREAEKLRDPDQRNERKRAVETQYRDPALQYLKQSAGAEVPSSGYVAALLAYYEGRFDDALGHLDAIGGDLSWFYEAPKLRGDVLLARGGKHRLAGETDAASADLEAGRRAYATAAAIGESVPVVHEALGELEYEAMRVALYGDGDTAPPFEHGVAALHRALSILPDHYTSLLLASRFHRSMAEERANHSDRADDLLEEALSAAQRAVAVAPERTPGRLELARSYRQLGEYLQLRNENPAEPLGNALDVSETVPDADRDGDFYVNLGLIHATQADYDDDVGADSRTSRGLAIDAYAQAAEMATHRADLWINLGMNYLARASLPRAPDPDRDSRNADGAFDRARSINPRHLVLLFYEGKLHELLGQRALMQGADPAPEWERSLDWYGQGLAINRKLPHLHNGISIVRLDEAQEVWEHGGDPALLLEQSSAAAKEAIAVAPDQGWGYGNMGEAIFQRAYYALERGDDPRPGARAAIASFQRAIARMPDVSAFWSNLGAAEFVLARYELERARDPSRPIARASEALARAIACNPNDAQAYVYLAQVRALSAQRRGRTQRDSAADFDAASTAFTKAVELAPDKRRFQLAFGQFYRVFASWQKPAGIDAEPTLDRGLELAEGLLARWPAWAEARVLRASLLRLRGAWAPRLEEQRAAYARAAEDFAGAFRANPNLEKAWRSEATRVERLAIAAR